MTRPDVYQILNDLETWQPIMNELTANPTPRAINYTPTPTNNKSVDSQPEKATINRLRFINELARIQDIANTLNSGGREGGPFEVIRAEVDATGTSHLAWGLMLARLEKIHARWENIINPKEQSNTLCPMCGNYLHWNHAQRIYTCDCGYSGTIDQVRNMRRWKIRNSDTWISRAQARDLYNLTAEALRWHIHQGTLTQRHGQLHTTELNQLNRKEKSC